MKKCTQCGNEVNDGVVKCPVCGASFLEKEGKIESMLSGIKAGENSGKPKSKILFVLLSWLGFGLGWLYIGYKDKFVKTSSLALNFFKYTLMIVTIPLGILYMVRYLVAYYSDFLKSFFVKTDGFGNKLK